jgi:hypothetical protein
MARSSVLACRTMPAVSRRIADVLNALPRDTGYLQLHAVHGCVAPVWRGLMRRLSPSPFGLWVRLLLGVLGAASFGAGVTAVFRTMNGTGTGVLLAFGGTVLVLALLGDRIESLEFGGTRLKLRAAAAEKFALAEESENQGDTITAARLRAEARALLETAGPIASEYRAVRGSMPAGRARTMAMERVVARARQLAAEQSFEPAEVIRWLQD